MVNYRRCTGIARNVKSASNCPVLSLEPTKRYTRTSSHPSSKISNNVLPSITPYLVSYTCTVLYCIVFYHIFIVRNLHIILHNVNGIVLLIFALYYHALCNFVQSSGNLVIGITNYKAKPQTEFIHSFVHFFISTKCQNAFADTNNIQILRLC